MTSFRWLAFHAGVERTATWLSGEGQLDGTYFTWLVLPLGFTVDFGDTGGWASIGGGPGFLCLEVDGRDANIVAATLRLGGGYGFALSTETRLTLGGRVSIGNEVGNVVTTRHVVTSLTIGASKR